MNVWRESPARHYNRAVASPGATDLTRLSLAEAAGLLRQSAISPVELTQACLRQIERLNPVLNAFITVTNDTALEQARTAEREIRGGRYRGPLHGIPLALKDLIDTAGVATTAGSALFQQRVPNQDAAVVQRLRQAGAVLLGKLNLHEFAYGGSGVISHFGATRNPWAPRHIAGGSSSGSAAAVAAGLCFGALGTDTAGSIRLPAACCGVAGLKPSYGLVSTRGVIPLSWSMDHVGPLARTVEDAALILQAIAGYDAHDLYSRELPISDYAAALGGSTSAVRLGILRQFFFDDLDAEVMAAINNALQVFESLTAGLTDTSIPVDTDRTVQAAEAYAWHAAPASEHPELYQAETLQRIRRGAEISAADYIHKWRELQQMRQATRDLFAQVDLLVSPTTPEAAPAIAELEADPGQLRKRELVLLRNTRPFNVLGLPAISVPCGFTGAGLPVGLQIAGPPAGEAQVLRLAHAYEQATEWHRRWPL